MTTLAACIVWLMHEAMVDDAYITLVYARNIAYHFHWGMLPGQIANTATSPLNVLLLGAVTFVVRGPALAAGVVYVSSAAALAFGLARLGESTGIGRYLAWVGAPLLLLNPLLASTLGLETTLAITLLVYLAWAAVRANARWFGVVSALTVLARLDLVVFVAFLFLARPALWRSIHRVTGWAAMVSLPWFVFSWVVLGSLVPDTLLIKQNADWGSFTTGLIERLGELYPIPMAGALCVPFLGLAALLTWPWWRGAAGTQNSGLLAALGSAGLAYFGVFALLGVPPHFWYYGPTLGALTICASTPLSLLARRLPSQKRSLALTMGVALLAIPALMGWGVRAQDGVPFTHALVHGNWARPAQYAEIGRELAKVVDGGTVRSPGEIGTLLFFCRCHLVDRFSDRGRLADAIAEAKRSSLLMRINYAFLQPKSLVKDQPDYRLNYRSGSDPSGRNWNVYSPTRGHGYLELTRIPDSS